MHSLKSSVQGRRIKLFCPHATIQTASPPSVISSLGKCKCPQSFPNGAKLQLGRQSRLGMQHRSKELIYLFPCHRPHYCECNNCIPKEFVFNQKESATQNITPFVSLQKRQHKGGHNVQETLSTCHQNHTDGSDGNAQVHIVPPIARPLHHSVSLWICHCHLSTKKALSLAWFLKVCKWPFPVSIL